MLNMISNAFGIAVLPPIVVQSELRSGQLHVLTVQPQFPPVRYGAIYPDPAPSRLCSLTANIAGDVVRQLSTLYDKSLMGNITD